MGYYENIRDDNRKYREKRARMHPLRRKLQDFLIHTFMVIAGMIFWVFVLLPLWIWLFDTDYLIFTALAILNWVLAILNFSLEKKHGKCQPLDSNSDDKN